MEELHVIKQRIKDIKQNFNPEKSTYKIYEGES